MSRLRGPWQRQNMETRSVFIVGHGFLKTADKLIVCFDLPVERGMDFNPETVQAFNSELVA